MTIPFGVCTFVGPIGLNFRHVRDIAHWKALLRRGWLLTRTSGNGVFPNGPPEKFASIVVPAADLKPIAGVSVVVLD